MNVIEALQARRSVRAFLDIPVSEALLRQVLDAARWAPSGGNIQPWQVIAVSGHERDAVCELAARKFESGAESEEGDAPIFPTPLWDPYRSRRWEIAEALHSTLHIDREDKTARLTQALRNFTFFGAPVGLFFAIDRRLGRGQWAHLGMFMHAVALSALEVGLASCMQEAWAKLRVSLGQHFGLPEEMMIYCGMALGYPDPAHPVNTLHSTRVPVDAFASLRGFEPDKR